MTSNEIRSSFLRYFADRQHRVVSSAPLVPHDDPTLLFTNAGMNQFKDVFLGKRTREYARATTSQKCMRVSGKHNDLENVGPSFRHHTFFEMLGNFSFGDYFKPDAIAFSWELLTNVWQLPPERLVVSVFRGDDAVPRDNEAYDLWRALVPADHILELGRDDNFWQMGETGPCGRSSEIYYVRGEGEDAEIELWNNVFMEFERDADGVLTPLPAPSIDTGMGLERISAVLQGVTSNYDTDLFGGLLDRIASVTGCPPYGGSIAPSDVSMRVIADHARAMTFLIADGVLPSNEWRGYVLRKIMRRAMRHGKHLGMAGPFLHSLVAVLDQEMGDAYPEIRANRETLARTILAEEERFIAVLDDGLPRLEAALAEARAAMPAVLSGAVAFRLYDTFGLPLDFIEDTAATQGVTVDKEGYETSLEAQRTKARAKSAFDGGPDAGATFGSAEREQQLRNTADVFEGYGATTVEGARVVAVFDDERREIDALEAGQAGFVMLDRTPFYLEAGGQVSDTGRLRDPTEDTAAAVTDVVRIDEGLPRVHRVSVTSGRIRHGQMVTAVVTEPVRDATRRNHTATHLLHAALRRVLGAHVKQAGSLVAPDRLRFDFVHFQPLTHDELDAVERLVNEHVYANHPVVTEEQATEEAVAAGAMALFGEKYGDRVRVVSVPGFSQELCGGTHCRATGDIGLFTIVSEGGVSAGVRRIEAITGAVAVARHQRDRDALQQVVSRLHVTPEQVPEAIERLHAEVKRLTKETTRLRTASAMGEGAPEQVTDVSGVKVVRQRVENLDKPGLRSLADAIRGRLGSGIVLVATTDGDKVSLVASVSKDLVPRVHAGRMVKALAPLVGGRGGGRPDFAEAGGKDPGGIDAMLDDAIRVIERSLAGPA